MLCQPNALPRAQSQAAVPDGDVERAAEHAALDVSGEIVRALGRVNPGRLAALGWERGLENGDCLCHAHASLSVK